jgi:hypothetical protein
MSTWARLRHLGRPLMSSPLVIVSRSKFMPGAGNVNAAGWACIRAASSATHRAEAFMRDKRFDATLIHTHTFPLDQLPEALRYARDRVEDAVKVVVKMRGTG